MDPTEELKRIQKHKYEHNDKEMKVEIEPRSSSSSIGKKIRNVVDRADDEMNIDEEEDEYDNDRTYINNNNEYRKKHKNNHNNNNKNHNNNHSHKKHKKKYYTNSKGERKRIPILPKPNSRNMSSSNSPQYNINGFDNKRSNVYEYINNNNNNNNNDVNVSNNNKKKVKKSKNEETIEKTIEKMTYFQNKIKKRKKEQKRLTKELKKLDELLKKETSALSKDEYELQKYEKKLYKLLNGDNSNNNNNDNRSNNSNNSNNNENNIDLDAELARTLDAQYKRETEDYNNQRNENRGNINRNRNNDGFGQFGFDDNPFVAQGNRFRNNNSNRNANNVNRNNSSSYSFSFSSNNSNNPRNNEQQRIFRNFQDVFNDPFFRNNGFGPNGRSMQLNFNGGNFNIPQQHQHFFQSSFDSDSNEEPFSFGNFGGFGNLDGMDYETLSQLFPNIPRRATQQQINDNTIVDRFKESDAKQDINDINNNISNNNNNNDNNNNSKKDKKKKKKSCCICLEPFKENDEIRRLPCLHIFHKKEIDKWLRTKDSCPICRVSITSHD